MDGTQIDEVRDTVNAKEHQEQPQPAAPSATKTRVISAEVHDGVVTIKHTAHAEPLARFDAGRLLGQPIARNLLGYGAASLLRQAAGGEDPQKGVYDMIERLESGDWRPGRKAVTQEVEPVIEALAQHLGKDVDYIKDTYLPRYCAKAGLVMSNGRSMLAAARADLAKHPDIAPLVTRIITQRAKSAKNQPTHDLAALAAE